MIIHRLAQHHQALVRAGKAPEYPWCFAPVNLGIRLSAQGEVLDLVPLTRMVRVGKKDQERPQELIVPMQEVRSSGISPQFLCDNATYLLGVDVKGAPARAKEQFDASRDYHLSLLDGLDGPSAKGIRAFFTQWDAASVNRHPLVLREMEAIKEGRNLVFMLQGDRFAHEDPEIAQAWIAHCNQYKPEDYQVCLVSGKREPIARIHGKIKNVPGAQSSGASLISINADAFVSYNLSGDIPGAPIGEYSAFGYVTALNILLADFEHRMDLGDTRVVYWAEEANGQAADVIALTMMPPPETDEHVLQDIFRRIAQRRPVQDIPLDTRFYVLGLRPNAARVSVALYLESSFGDMIANISGHYERLEIIRPVKDKRVYLTPWAIMEEIINPNSTKKKPNPQTMVGLMRSILLGTPYPRSLYHGVIQRIRAEQGDGKISRGRAAIVKACLMQTLGEEERKCVTVPLNTQSTNKPYLLGRLFSLLEAVQETANPGVNTTIKDRFFNAACATPGVAFPQIMKLSESHIKKIKRDKPGMSIFHLKQVQEVLTKLDVEDDPFPKSLSLNDQGLFILGYYQQTQDRYTKKEEA